MEFKASHRFARISPRKARLVVDMVRGQPINRALQILQFSPKRAAFLIRKVVQSALANANMDENVNVNRLVVSDARVDDGPLLQGRLRYRFRARGGVVPIRKRTCHISIKLSEPAEQAKRKNAKKSKEPVEAD